MTSSTVACFADDTKVVKRIDSPADCAALQLDLTSLVSWSIFWQLLFNQIKCKHQRITRKINPVLNTYAINDIDVEICDSERDLGVWVTSDLTGISKSRNNALKPTSSLALREEHREISKALGPDVHCIWQSYAAT